MRRAFPSLLVASLALSASLLLPSSTFGAPANPPPLDTIVGKVDQASKDVTTLSGEFTQKNKVKLFKQELTSKGRVYFKKPRQIRWEYLAPDASTMILDGDKATLRSPGNAPQEFDLAKDATMRAIFDQLLTWLGPGSLERARADYDMKAGGTASAPELLLTPKATSAVAKAFTEIRLRLDPKSWIMKSIALVEKNGDEKEIVFSKLERNAKLPADAFK